MFSFILQVLKKFYRHQFSLSVIQNIIKKQKSLRVGTLINENMEEIKPRV